MTGEMSMSAPRVWWSSSDGRLELQLTLAQARSASHQGQCDDDVRALSQEPDIAAQVAQWKPEDVRRELQGHGAWDEAELADHDQNLQRALWLAAGYVMDSDPPDGWEECGICGHYHSPGFTGDCRDDENRWP